MTHLRYMPGLGIWTLWPITGGCAEAFNWLGTPHKNRIAQAGPDGGIDCLYLVGRIMVAAKMIPPFQFPYYHHAVGIRESRNVMEALFTRVCDVEVIEPNEPVTDGDVMVFKSGNISNHVGIILSGNLIESEYLHGVRIRPADKYQVDQFQSVCRLNRKGFTRRPETLTRDELYGAAVKKEEVRV